MRPLRVDGRLSLDRRGLARGSLVCTRSRADRRGWCDEMTALTRRPDRRGPGRLVCRSVWSTSSTPSPSPAARYQFTCRRGSHRANERRHTVPHLAPIHHHTRSATTSYDEEVACPGGSGNVLARHPGPPVTDALDFDGLPQGVLVEAEGGHWPTWEGGEHIR